MIRPKLPERNDNVAIPGETNSLGNDTNYFTPHSIDIQTLSKGDRQRTKTTSPEPFADQDNLGRTGLVVFLYEIASETRRHL